MADTSDLTPRDDTGTGSDTPRAIKRIPATPAMRKAVADSKRDLTAGYPFLASLASSDSLHYHAINDPEIPVAMTDGTAIYFNATAGGWFDSKTYNADERVFIHAHEVLHVVREDPMWLYTFKLQGFVSVPRTPACPDGRLPYDEATANRVADAIINSGLIVDGVGSPPKDTFLHPSITWETPFGEGYATLYQKSNPPPPGQGQGQGQGKPNKPKDQNHGDVAEPGSMGDPEGDDSPESSQPRPAPEAAQKLAEGASERNVAVKRAINAARQAGVGSSAAEAMTEASREPGVDWRAYITGFLARVGGSSSYDFRRPSRPPLIRELLGDAAFYAPSRGGHGCNHVVFVGDTSGSIREDEHRAMLSSVCEMAGDLNPRIITVVWCDDRIQRVDVFEGVPGADTLRDFYAVNKIPRGGGTSFIPPFEMLESVALGSGGRLPDNMGSDAVSIIVEAGQPDGLIYFTDLYGTAPAEAPPYPTLWLVVNDMEPAWGEHVQIDPQELLT